MPVGGDDLRKLKKYKPTAFKAKDSVYDKDAADYAVNFIECLCHTKGTWAGRPFELIDWQEQIIRDLFGILKPNGYRQFNAPTKPPQTSPFTGLITCAICGKHYRRKTTATGPVWICSTYNSYGKSYCPSKAIPEEKLIQTAALVGHTGEITAITAHNDNLLEFTLKDGTNAVKRWQDRSRAESWTAEIRRAAGEKTRERKQHHAES